MGVMVEGTWDPDRENLTDPETGRFERSPTTFRDEVGTTDAHPVEAGRYHLYISRACPWAHRTAIVRRLLGLEDVISLDIVDPVRHEHGWEFSPEKPACTADTATGSSYLREVYADADPDYSGRVTVPVLWDRQAKTIVNNESADIIQQFDDAFADLASRDITLYPDGVSVTETITRLYEPINNGVYKAGFAENQAAYEQAVDELFDALAHWDELLADQRFVCGQQLTAADVCLFTTMYRFDEVYHTHFKCNHRRLIDFPNLWGHTREIYQLPGVARTCNMDHCKRHYYRSHRTINPKGIIPIGPCPEFSSAHDRTDLPGGPPEELRARR